MTNKRVQELFQKAIDICSNNGYKPNGLISYCFYSTDHTLFGRCIDYYNTRIHEHQSKIYINKDFAKKATENQVLEVLIHECLHSSVGCKEGHKGKWKEAAEKLNKLYNLKIDSTEDYVDNNGNDILDEKSIAKYVLQCTNCGFKCYYRTKCKTVKNYNNGNYHCPVCNRSQFKLIR